LEVSRSFPVRMIESGPAAGAIAAGHFALDALERPDAIAFDMGGTTAKISVIRNGKAAVTHHYEVGHVHRFKRGSGYPLQISAIELLEIGAGGGSIAHVNELGLLKVGPHSASADPGPVCYARGGDQPTVTDADLLLGYLNPDNFLGGNMKLEPELAESAIAAGIAAMVVFIAERGNAAVGVGVSITTIPAAAYIGIALAERAWSDAGNAAIVLMVNIACVVGAEILTGIALRKYLNLRVVRL